MPASDAAPLPRAGEVFFDVRGHARTMRVSWYGDTGVAVFSIWNGGTCTGTFRLPIPELPRMIDALTRGPGGAAPLPPAARASQQVPPGAADPGPPTAAMRFPGPRDHQDGPGYADAPPAHPGARHGYRDDPQIYQDDDPQIYQETAGYGHPGYEDVEHGYAGSLRGYGGVHGEYTGADPGRPYYQPEEPSSRQPATAGYADWAHLPGGRPGEAAGGPPGGQWQPGERGGGRYADDDGPAGGYDMGPDVAAEPPHPGPAIDELGADPLEADYGGEAEQGYLPGPPTETFSPVAVGDSHGRLPGQAGGGHSGTGYAGTGQAGTGQAGTARGGHRKAPEDPQDTGGHRAYALPRDPASESLSYHPGRAGRREREYRPTRDGY